VKKLLFAVVCIGIFVVSGWSLEIQCQPGQIWVGTPVQFSIIGIDSSMPLSATWNMGDSSPQLNGLTVSHEFKDPGTYSIQCTFADGRMLTRSLQVMDHRQITASPGSPKAGEMTTFQTQFFARNQLRWNFGDGSVENGSSPISHTFSNPGSFEVKAFDYNGESSQPVKITIIVAPDNRTLTMTGGTAKANFPTEFQAANFNVSPLQWNFGDGTTETAPPNVQHVYRNPGNFSVSVTVPGQNSASAKTLAIQVSPDPRRVEVLPSNPGKYEAVSMQAVGFPDGNLLWDFGDGAQVTANRQVSHAYDRLGNFTVTVKGQTSSALPVSTQIRIQRDRRELKLVPETVQVGAVVQIKALNVTAGSVNWRIGSEDLMGRPSEISHRFVDPGFVDVVCNIPGQTPLTARIRVNDSRRIAVSPKVVFTGSKVDLTLLNGKGPGVRWEITGGVSRNNGLLFTHEFTQPGSITIQAYDFNGTAKTPVTKKIQVIPDNREIVSEYKTIFAGAKTSVRALRFRDASIQWDFGDGQRRMGTTNMEHLYSNPGLYTLKAVDFRGRDGKNVTLSVQVLQDTRKIIHPNRIREGEAVDLELTGVTGDRFSWDLGEAGRHTGRKIRGVLFRRPGSVQVRIEDSSQVYPPFTALLMVQADTRRVTVPVFALPGEAVAMKAENFDGPKVAWTFGDGSADVVGAKSVSHVYAKPGTFTFVARDNGGAGKKEFTGTLSVVELSPRFTLQYLELAFDSGKAYSVVPLKNRPPRYSLKMKGSGRGILRGKWKLDDQTLGLFTIVLRDGETAVLKRSQMPKLPVPLNYPISVFPEESRHYGIS